MDPHIILQEQNTSVTKRVGIVGAGLVGSLASVYFAQRGWEVKIFEKRPDIRKIENANKLNKRSINLALSQRGISALSKAGLGLDKLILSKVIPMKGRMIHQTNGSQKSQPYGLPTQHINSVDRGMLNEVLLNTVASLPNVEILFDHTLLKSDLDAGTLTFKNELVDVTYEVDFILGADGAYSQVRQDIMKRTRTDYSQSFIGHAYCELTIPPKLREDGLLVPQLDQHHLHIWPRHSYMMIALPNLDKSFTCTLFAPRKLFDSITNEAELLALFEKDLGDAVPLIGREALVKEYFANPKGSLLSIKCNPYHYKGRALIVGDAAHSMVPFYGQGMNAGFEDIETLFDILDRAGLAQGAEPYSPTAIERCLNEYSTQRHPDAAAMCDLALHNYIEMRSSVVNVSYRARKHLESFLHHIFPSKIIPLYTMVSFSNMRYSEVRRRWQWQSDMLANATIAAATALSTGSLVAAYMYLRPNLRIASSPISTPTPLPESWVPSTFFAVLDLTKDLWRNLKP